MSIFKTWDEIADYVTNTTGLKYLDNPTTWMNAFKEKVGNSRFVEVVNDVGEYIGEGFVNNQWVSEGEWQIPSVGVGGAKSLPTTETIVTDVATGGAIAGASAVATKATGITIELTVAGYFATVLTGLGVGVASYELFPDFYRDISNYVFGTNLTPSETEPFLRKKIKTILSSDGSDGKPITFIPEVLVKRTYDFLAQHLNSSLVHNNFPTAVINPSNGDVTSNYMQTMDYLKQTYLSKDSMQEVMNNVVGVLHNVGFSNIRPIDISDLYTEMQSNMDVSGLDLITYNVSCGDWNVWNNGLVVPEGSSNTLTCFSVNGYRLSDAEKSESYRLNNARKFTQNDIGYLGQIHPTLVKEPSVSGSFAIFSWMGEDTPREPEIHIAQNQESLYSHSDKHVSQGGADCLHRYVGYYPIVNVPTGVQDNYGIFLTNPMYCENIRYSNPVEYEESTTDEYLGDKAIVNGRVPRRDVSLENRYPSWYGPSGANVKVVSQPNKYGGDDQKRFIPATTPYGNDVPDNVIKGGVNYGTTGGYKEEQDVNQKGKNTPNIATPNQVNEGTESSVDDYNKSDVSPETAPDPAPATQPLPEYPTTPPTEPTGDSGDTPTPTAIGGVTASGMVSVYNPTKQELIDFSGWLWSPSFLDNFLKIFANPMDAIIGLHVMYATPISGGSEHIIAGYLDSNVSSKVVTKQYSKIDCGTITVPEYYGNATDYEPYTTIHIYLPFIGIMPLRANDVMGKQLHVEYGIDAITGTCLASITTKKDDSEITCYTFAGNCAVQIPVSGGNYAEMIKAISGFIVAGAGAIATGNPLLAVGAGASFMTGNTSVQHSGAIGSNAGACGIRKPYLIITRKIAYNAQNYQHYYGFPSNNHVKLGSCKGYTQVKSCHVESVYRATDNEKSEIDTLLKQGVIII